MLINELKKLQSELQCEGFEKGVSYKGKESLIPIYKEGAIIGEPTVVFFENGKYRLSNYDESFEYLKYEQKVKGIGEEEEE